MGNEGNHRGLHRQRVERWRREQKRKVMVEVQEEVKEEKRRQRKAQLEDKDNPWVDDDDSAEEACVPSAVGEAPRPGI